MMIFIGLFLPSFIAMIIRQKRNTGGEKQWFSVLLEYGKTVLFCNLIVMSVITYILKIDNVGITAFNSFPFFTKYVILAIVYSVSIPYLEEIIKKVFCIEFTILGRNDEERTETTGSK